MNVDVLHIVGQVVTYGGGTFSICYLALRTLGMRWLDEKFKKRLVEFKRFQDQEFENYRFEINKLFNRITKIHEMEFEILPTAWQKLQIAHGIVSEMTSPLQSYPDLDKMSNLELSEFLKSSGLFEFQKDELLKEKNKLEYYREKIFRIRYSEVARKIMEFHNYILLNKILLKKEMFELFSEIDSRLYESHLMSDALIDKSHATEIWKTLREANNNIQPLINKLEELIQKRLHFEDAE